MKKSLIAIAALAAAGAAAAQSSVTMYGQVNTGYAYTKTDVTDHHGVKTTVKTTGVANDRTRSSRLGFKGQESLGNGLSATFALEMGLNYDGSFKGGAAFDRKATVGLKGAFGEVSIGKADTPLSNFDGSYKAIDATNALSESEKYSADYEARPTGLFYNGSFSGFNVEAAVGNTSYKQATGGTTEKKVTSSTVGLGMGYGAGAWAVGAAFQYDTKKEEGTLVAPKVDGKVTSYAVGATYDFNVAKLYGQYKGGQYKNKASVDTQKYSYDQFAIGVSAPFGATTLSAEYGYNKSKETTGAKIYNFKGNVFAVQADYAFSKRTSVYARAGQVYDWKVKNGNSKSSTQEYTVGLRHKF